MFKELSDGDEEKLYDDNDDDEELGTKCYRHFILYGCNAVFVVIGFTMLILGILAQESKNVQKFVGRHTNYEQITIFFVFFAILYIAVGIFGAVAGKSGNVILKEIYSRWLFGVTLGCFIGFISGFLVFSPDDDQLKDDIGRERFFDDVDDSLI